MRFRVYPVYVIKLVCTLADFFSYLINHLCDLMKS